MTIGWFLLAATGLGGLALAGRHGLLAVSVPRRWSARAVSLRRRWSLPRPPAINGDLFLASALVVGVVCAGLAIVLLGPSLLGGVPLWLVPLLLVPLLVLPIWMATTHRKPLALAVLLLYMGLADGALKLQSSSELPGLGRDLLFYAIAIGMLVPMIVRRRPVKLPPLSAWVLVFVAVVAVQLFNPDNGSLVHSVASLRQHLEFVPLFFIAYSVMQTATRLRGFFVLLALVGAVNGVVGSIQLGLSPEQLSAWGPGYSNLINGDPSGGISPRTAVGEDGGLVVRPPGLGSDMGFAGVLGGIAIPGALALLIAGRRRRLGQQLVSMILLAGCITAVATSLSRSAVVSAVVGVLAFACLMGVARPRKIPAVAAALILFIGIAAAVSVYAAQGREGDFERLTSITPDRAIGTTVESRSTTLSLIPTYIREFPLGAGIGSVGPASGVIDPPPRKFLNAESQFTFMLVELGVPGLLAFVALNVTLVVLLLRWIRYTATYEMALLMAAVGAPLFSFMAVWIVGVVTVSTPNNVYFWFAAGTLAYWLGPRQRRTTAPIERDSRSRARALAPSGR